MIDLRPSILGSKLILIIIILIILIVLISSHLSRLPTLGGSAAVCVPAARRSRARREQTGAWRDLFALSGTCQDATRGEFDAEIGGLLLRITRGDGAH